MPSISPEPNPLRPDAGNSVPSPIESLTETVENEIAGASRGVGDAGTDFNEAVEQLLQSGGGRIDDLTGGFTDAGGDMASAASGESAIDVPAADSLIESAAAGATSLVEEAGEIAGGLASASADFLGPVAETDTSASPAATASDAPAGSSEASVAPSEFPAAFPAPGEGETTLARTREVIDAFLRSATWKERLRYVYNGDSLAPAVEEYYKQWPFVRTDRFSLQFFSVEESAVDGNPYWVYFVSTSDQDPGYPVLIRVEDGNLKIDWEIYAEFQDRHFARFLEGGIASPHTFRVLLEQKSDYFGADREGFSDLDQYLVFDVYPPYGGPGEYTASAFVKKGSELAERLDQDVSLAADPLAVIVTLDWQSFSHGIKHLIVTEYRTEGWFD